MALALAIAAIGGAVLLVHYGIERPTLAMGHRLAARASPG